MERKLGTLSYNPKILVPFYNGTGPNRFYDFMQNKLRQNIVNACYNDSLTGEQISLETGIPLPYLDEEITALTTKKILIKNGTHYKSNVIVITSDCADEIFRESVAYHNEIADMISLFLRTHLECFKEIGFTGHDFSNNSLCWQLMTFILAAISCFDTDVSGTNDASSLPKTGWGDCAYLWLVEQNNSLLNNNIFNHSQVNSHHGDYIYFYDYLPDPKGSHYDFYGNMRNINILCDIAHGNWNTFSEYDLETVTEMIKQGYVLKEKDTYRVTMPIFTTAQYAEVTKLTKNFVSTNLGKIIKELHQISTAILIEHTPKHLQKQAAVIAGMNNFVNAACIPTGILIDRNILSTNWNPLEMPTMFIVIH